VIDYLETEPLLQLPLKLIQNALAELLNPTTAKTDEVMVVIRIRLEMAMPLAEIPFLHPPQTFQ
jgi:hypothetical protein